MRLRSGATAGLLVLAELVLPSPARAGLAEDMAYCQTNVWPRFAGWSLSRQRGADEPSTPVDFFHHYTLRRRAMLPLVTLNPFQPSHLELLAVWLRQPHVARWYPNPVEDLARAMNPPAGASQAIIARGSAEVGYVRWQHVDRDALDALGLHEIPANSVDVDILLGNEGCVGQGVGPSALTVLAAELRQDARVPLLGLTTSVQNTRAHRAFEKAGFHIARQYDPNGLGLCHLMVRDLRRERAVTSTEAGA